MVSCQVCPNRAGWLAASETPAEKVKAASTPSTPATAPTRADRTGTVERPRPGSSANRAPITRDTGKFAAAAAAATADRRWAAGLRPAVSATAAAAAEPASTTSGIMTHPAPRTSQSTSIPGCGSMIEAKPIGIHREATMAPATPSVPPLTPARNGPAEAAAMACRRVMPTAWSTWRSATVAEVYRATDWPMRNTAATSAASPKASRQAASYAVILRAGTPICWSLSHTSMSERPVTRARSVRKAGIAASPPLSRTSALMYVWPLVPSMLTRYRVNRAGDERMPPGEPGVSASSPHGVRITPTMRTRTSGPRGGPVVPSYPWLACCGLARSRVSLSPTCLPEVARNLGVTTTSSARRGLNSRPARMTGRSMVLVIWSSASGNPLLAAG